MDEEYMELNDHKESLRGEHVLQHPYRRATGPILGRFFTEIRDHGRFLGVKTAGRCGPGHAGGSGSRRSRGGRASGLCHELDLAE
jgi:hypothetical protein